MADHPILMSAPMVRACLDGSKTQTRRTIKPQPPDWARDYWGKVGTYSGLAEPIHYWKGSHPEYPEEDLLLWPSADKWSDEPEWDRFNGTGLTCPYGSEDNCLKAADRLWVRESFWAYGKWVKNGHTKKGKQRWAFRFHEDQIVCFDANPDGTRIKRGEAGYGWVRRPGIHMPRWACRIELEVTGVRVERLQEISEADAEAEGCERLDAERYEPDWKLCPRCGGTRLYDGIGAGMGVLPDQDCHDCDTYVKRYKHLWNSINGAGAWDANPFVWVIEFKRVKP